MSPTDHEFPIERRTRQAAFLRRFREELIADAPPDLDEVEAAIDAEPPAIWVPLVRLAFLGYTVGFWLAIAWFVFA